MKRAGARMGSSETKHILDLSELVRRFWSLVPLGGSLPVDVWHKRHRFLLGLTWLHAVVIAFVGVVLGYRWELSLAAFFDDETVLHTFGEGLVVAFFAAVAGWSKKGRAFRATMVGFGLISSSAILVHLSGGYIELHFHFFVMLTFLALYQDWVPYVLAIVYVALHHGVVGAVWPASVYNHTAAIESPWTWAGIHAFFVLWASVGSIIAWRFNEIAFARAKLILDSAGEGIFGLDREGKVTFINPAAAKMLGLDTRRIAGRARLWPTTDPMEPYQPGHAATLFAPLTDGVACHATDALFWRDDGTSFPVDYISNPIVERGQMTGVVVTFRDVTDRKKNEEALARKTEELQRSNTELEQFAYVASHDLQEPLRMVRSYTQLLAKRYQGKLDTDAGEFIQFAVDGVTRMQGLLNDLLAFSRVGTQGKEFTPTQCEAVLAGTVANLRVAIEETGAKITHDPLPMVMADGTQLGQLFQNLLGNAIKFHNQKAPRVHVSAKQDGKKWVFSVKDNGIGIDPQYAERIFVIFQRLHGRGQYPGTGIGLAVCKKIVERHGGNIWVESGLGKGATFYFTVPAHDSKNEGRAP